MNNSTQFAQEKTGRVTAHQLLNVIRKGDRHFMHGEALNNRPSYSDAFEFKFTSQKSASRGKEETTTKISIPGFVSNGNTSHRKEHSNGTGRWTTFDETYRPLHGFWSLWCIERLRDVLEILPPDAGVSFEVSLDAGTNGLCISASCAMEYWTEEGLHGDHLYLVVDTKRGGRRFLIDATVSGHNSARFGGAK